MELRLVPMGRLAYSDDLVRKVLAETKTIALVGASPDSARPSNRVMRFLKNQGYRVYPVNPTIAGQSIQGERVYATLDDVPKPIDMVDIFRRSALAGAVVDEAIRIKARFVWMQLDVIDEQAAARAEKAGLTVIMDRCPAIEHPRLMRA
jgi:predicted CoA-binding protein